LIPTLSFYFDLLHHRTVEKMLQFSILLLMRAPQGEVKDFAYRVWLRFASDDHWLLSSTIFPFNFFFTGCDTPSPESSATLGGCLVGIWEN
jgi:hypothetical protein